MSAPYSPPEEETESEPKRISIRLDKTETEELHFIADVWNALDVALGAKRRYKWTAASVMEKMIRVGIGDFYSQVGGAPREGESRSDFLRRAVGEIKKARKQP